MRNFHNFVLLSDNTWYQYTTAASSMAQAKQGGLYKARQKYGDSVAEIFVKDAS